MNLRCYGTFLTVYVLVRFSVAPRRNRNLVRFPNIKLNKPHNDIPACYFPDTTYDSMIVWVLYSRIPRHVLPVVPVYRLVWEPEPECHIDFGSFYMSIPHIIAQHVVRLLPRAVKRCILKDPTRRICPFLPTTGATELDIDSTTIHHL